MTVRAGSSLGAVAEDLVTAVRRARNADGGWGYFTGKASRLEPTCWALLALEWPLTPEAASPLVGWPVEGGLLEESAQGRVNYAFNGLAAVTLGRARGADAAALRGRIGEALVGRKGIRLPPSAASAQDNSLQAWPWVDGTFSWVEPTALCLLALKQAGADRPEGTAERVAEAERLLADRMCVGGGWNYGNSNVLGQNLRPHVPPTALALIALQDRPADHGVALSLAFLRAHARSERSGLALALTAICLRLFGDAPREVEQDLRARVDTLLAFGNVSVMAAALCGLARERDDAFRV